MREFMPRFIKVTRLIGKINCKFGFRWQLGGIAAAALADQQQQRIRRLWSLLGCNGGGVPVGGG